MKAFPGKVAIVTGGASGIGRAIGAQLAGHGARVVLADRNGEAASAAAGVLANAGGRVSAATVDVTDASAVQALVRETAAAHGRLDYLFNNAGVALAGEVRDMALADWDRLIDVNLRGVVHGIVAAYPLMIQQGFGHIVNTASAAGLGPTPGFTAYATTKHAVVGLSTSLRGEAARRGVRVSVVCPGFIDTPLLTTSTLLNIDRDAALKFMKFSLTSVDTCARAVLRGVARNNGIIVITPVARIGWVLYRCAPRLTLRAMAWFADYSPVLPPR